MFKNLELVFIRLTFFSILGLGFFGFLFIIFGLLYLFALVSSLLVLRLMGLLCIFFFVLLGILLYTYTLLPVKYLVSGSTREFQHTIQFNKVVADE